MKLRDQKRLDTHARIRQAARALLESHGLAATTFRAVASQAGVAVGTVHNYAGDKASLVVSLFVEDLQAVIDQRAATLPRGPLLSQMNHYFTGFLELYVAHPALARTYVKESVFAPDEAFSLYLQVTMDLLIRLTDLIRRSGELRAEVEPALAARLCFDTYIGTVVELLRQEDPGLDQASRDLEARLADVLAVMRPLGSPP